MRGPAIEEKRKRAVSKDVISFERQTRRRHAQCVKPNDMFIAHVDRLSRRRDDSEIFKVPKFVLVKGRQHVGTSVDAVKEYEASGGS